MFEYLWGYLPYLTLTLGLESLVVLSLSPRGQRRRAFHACLALNLLTHPLATLVILQANAPFSLLQVVIIGVEYLGYRSLVGLGAPRAICLAVLANSLSAVVEILMSVL